MTTDNGRRSELRKRAIDLHDTLVLWAEYGGPALPKQVRFAMNRLIGLVRDSDGSGEAGETQSGSTVGDSAGRNGIAQNGGPQ